MKIVYLLLFGFLLTHPTWAQNKYATTTDGKRVILKPDGTWTYATYDVSSKEQTVINKNTANDNSSSTSGKKTSSTAQSSRRYIRGPRGGCYYINSNGNKTYVDRSLCN